jgi:hypothetical protein
MSRRRESAAALSSRRTAIARHSTHPAPTHSERQAVS